MPALAILFGATFTAAVCAALGTLLLGRDPRDLPARFVTGAALLSLIVFLLCAARFAYPLVFLILGAAAVLLAGRPPWSRPQWSCPQWSCPKLPHSRLLLAAFAVYLVVYFFNAMAPEISYDGSRYHLGLAARYLRDHGFDRLTTNLYAALSQGVEMLYLFAFAFGRHSAASLVHFCFLLALVWSMWDYARRHGFPTAGAAACLLVFASPLAGVDATSAYNDIAVAAIAFTLFDLLERWRDVGPSGGRDQPSPRLLAAAGLLAGFGYAAKYTAWPGILYACAVPLISVRFPLRRRIAQAGLVAACAALLVLPWMAKNYLWFQNPLAPFFNRWFPNQLITASFESEYRIHMAHYSLTSLWQIPLQVTTFGSLSGLLGPVFLLAPVALLALNCRDGRRLLLAAAVFASTYFSNISARFLLPSLPFVALAMMLVLSRIPGLPLALALVQAILSWPTILPRYAHPDAWRLFKPLPYREALRIKPEDGYLQSNLPLYGAARMLDRLTRPAATVFTNIPIPEAYTSRNILTGYQSQPNIVSRAVLYSAIVPGAAPTWKWRFAFPRRDLRGLRLVQLGSGPEPWRVHEIRLFDGPRELPRTAWRLAAHPYPWGIENAFDGRLASFWLSSDPMLPGQSVSAEFSAPLWADAVLMETITDQPGLHLRLDALDPSGRWQPLTDNPQVDDTPTPPDFAPSALHELKLRGIDCVLVFDTEPGADVLRRHAGEWGVRELGESQGARLYELP